MYFTVFNESHQSELAELSSSTKMANENAGEQRDISTKLKTIEADRYVNMFITYHSTR